MRARKDSKGKAVKVICFYVSSIPESDRTLTSIPGGLESISEFISDQEELEIKNIILNQFTISLKKRGVTHFGKHFDYSTNSGSETEFTPIPDQIEKIKNKIESKTGEKYDQITVNYYAAGDGIPAHVDNPLSFGETIVSLSLLSDCLIQFKRDDNCYQHDLKRKSLLIMKNESRYSWEHTIVARKNDYLPSGEIRERAERMSVTFRRTVDSEEAGRLIEKNLVKNVYDKIAPDFSASRYKMWPLVAEFVSLIPSDCLIFDIGCGNGKNLAPLVGNGIGLEISIGLAQICRDRNLEVVLGDCTNTQIRSNVADYVMSIAVLHHMATHSRRIEALSEIGRILRPGAKAMVTSWAGKQEKNGITSSYVSKEETENGKETSSELPIHKARTKFKQKDVLVPFKGKTDGTSDDCEAVHRHV